MSAPLIETVPATPAAPFPPDSGEVVEVVLLLSAVQAAALEQAAHLRGLTAAEVVRRLLGAFIRNPSVL